MRIVGLAALALALAAPVAAASKPVMARISTSTATPIVGQPWRWTVTVKNAAGKPLAARMRLQILVGGAVVGCWKGGAMAQCLDGSQGQWITFKGKRTAVLTWPEQSVGVRLTFQALVVADKRTLRLRTPVTVRSA